ncbi:MAG: prenyltransferase [Thermodesulfobacteriota bacterium]
MAAVGDWIREIRGPFLALSVVLVFLGTSVAAHEGVFDLVRALLALIGLVLLHISVNVFNECSDYHTGIDFNTSPTPFSGGSGMLVQGRIAPSSAYAVAVASFTLAVLIGGVFVWLTNVWLLPLLVVGAVTVLCYTTFLAKIALGEIFAGLGLGLLPVLGCAFVQTGHYSPAAFAAGVPSGILTFNLLLINEFPDLDADVKGGRKNLLIVYGPETAGKIYTALFAFAYVWIVAAVALKIFPVYCLAALLTLPIAYKPMMWAWRDIANKEAMVPALGANVMTNLVCHALLGMGFVAAILLEGRV